MKLAAAYDPRKKKAYQPALFPNRPAVEGDNNGGQEVDREGGEKSGRSVVGKNRAFCWGWQPSTWDGGVCGWLLQECVMILCFGLKSASFENLLFG